MGSLVSTVQSKRQCLVLMSNQFLRLTVAVVERQKRGAYSVDH